MRTQALMTNLIDEMRRRLSADIEAYLCGEVPNPLELARATRMERWYPLLRKRGKEWIMVIVGDVYQHPETDDGQSIQSPAVQWFDREERFFRTTGRLYALGRKLGQSVPDISGDDI
jgi:hypothetical protein